MTLRAFNRLELFSAMRVALAAPPYRAKLDLLQLDATTGEITLASGVTYTHTSDIYAPDVDGVYRKFGANVPIVSGGRVVQNALRTAASPVTSSEDFSNGLVSGCSLAYADGVVTASASSDSAYFRPYASTDSSAWNRPVGTRIQFSVECRGKGSSVGKQVGLLWNSASSSARPLVTLAATWKRMVMDITVNAAVNPGVAIALGLDNPNVVTGEQVEFRRLQVEFNAPLVGEYVPVSATQSGTAVFATENGNTVDGNGVVTEAKGADIDPPPQLVYQPALSNIEDGSVSEIIVNGVDWTQTANWAASSRGILEGLYAIPGTVSSPRFFHAWPTDVAYTLGQKYVYEVIVKTNGWQWVQVCPFSTLGAATLFVNYDLTNNVFGNIGTNPLLLDYAAEQLGNGHVRLLLGFEANSTLAPTYGGLLYFINSNVTSRAPTAAGNSVDGLFVTQMATYEGATVKQVLGSGPIFTTGSTLATDRTVIQAPLTAHNNSAGLWYLDAEWSMPEAVSAAQGAISLDGVTSGSLLAYSSGDYFRMSDDGARNSDLYPADGFTLPGALKHVMVFSQADNKMRLFMGDSLAGAERDFDGFDLGTVIDVFLATAYPVKINALRSYSISSYDDGIALKDELLA